MSLNIKIIRPFLPFEDELYSFEIDDFHVINSLNKIILSGELLITNNKEGLYRARQLKRVIDSAVASLKNTDIDIFD